MTSGRFQSFPISSIFVERSERQRREMKQEKVADLAQSIAARGLINPIIVTEEGKLIAGETRFEACKALGWTHISVQFPSDLSEIELKLIELEENIKRSDLTWQEECSAVLELHNLYCLTDPNWSHQQTADMVGVTRNTIGQKIEVAKEMRAGNEKVLAADKFSVARNAVQRSSERRAAFALDDIAAKAAAVVGEEPAEPISAAPPLILADFHQWQESYDGPKFNLIHCDFPYGINVADSPRQNAAIVDYYKDSPDIYWSLLERLSLAMSNTVADNAHLIFWFSMDYYPQTLAALTEMGWKVNPFPLIWFKSDNAGIAPDPQRDPRRVYETAFFARRGDRKLTDTGPKANTFAFPGKREEFDHISAKPLPMLKHFLSMICDEYSSFFDPTCGGATSVQAAKDLGAASVLGIEQDEEFYNRACENWRG